MAASRTLRSVAVLLVVTAASGIGMSARAAGMQSVPSIELDRAVVRQGERVVVTLTGWPGRVVTVSVCGNLARRGSADCNQVASQGVGLNRDGSPTLTDFVVGLPSTTCPCVIRASSTTQDAVAVAPVELVGASVGPLIGTAAASPVRVSLAARRASGGLVSSLRSGLGGPTTYDVTVSVRNRSAETLARVVVTGSAMWGDRDVAALELPPGGPMEPGETWTRVVRTTVPAPVLGTLRWEVTASGAGPVAQAEVSTSNVPVALFVLALVFGVDIVAIAWRRIGRRGEPVMVTAVMSVIDLRSADPAPSGPDLRDQPALPVDDETVLDAFSEVSPR